jgi:pyruvate/2-oxoacid:ferredoxin oxidoreductase beta subunit
MQQEHTMRRSIVLPCISHGKKLNVTVASETEHKDTHVWQRRKKKKKKKKRRKKTSKRNKIQNKTNVKKANMLKYLLVYDDKDFERC